MSATTPALFAAAAGVGFGHAVLPDHWVPLAVLGRSRRYPLAKIARLSGLAGVAHVLLSIVLGAVIIAVGLQFRHAVASAQDTIIGGLLVVTGLGFAMLQATGHGHHHDHSHDHHGHGHGDDHAGHDDHRGHGHAHHHHDRDHLGGWSFERDRSDPGERRGISGLAAVMVPFGAAASPDLTILPVFLAATTAGVATAVGSVLIFGAATIGTIVGLTLGAARGGYQIKGEWLDRWGNAVTALVLVVIGALVLAGIV
jgi:nickel/cobalt transporter (NicO) family protein